MADSSAAVLLRYVLEKEESAVVRAGALAGILFVVGSSVRGEAVVARRRIEERLVEGIIEAAVVYVGAEVTSSSFLIYRIVG